MILTKQDAAKAEAAARDQRVANFKLLQLDLDKAGDAGDLAQRMKRMADEDPLKFDGWLAKPEVVKLFAAGALLFGGGS